jgi:3,4-dihydroxy 2-butanone 4-phosphate synthase/GTP cyclohydrolase II
MSKDILAINKIIDDVRNGKPVIIMDDEQRENEGDLIIAAELVTAEHINFMATYGRGLICLTLTSEHALNLRLSPMVRENRSGHGTNFTASIEASTGVTTGISAEDRATTVRAAIAEGANSNSIVSPGHIFPLIAESGGVLNRAGHTEAGCDLTRLAGLKSAAVIVEILNPDGTMARKDQLIEFAIKHKFNIGTVADLIEFRLKTETSIHKQNSRLISTEFGSFLLIEYFDRIKKLTHYALVKNIVPDNEPILVRVHVHDLVTDLFGRKRGVGWESPLKNSLYRLAKEKNAVLVLLTPESKDKPIERSSSARKCGTSDVQIGDTVDIRTFGIGAQILRDLGVKNMRVLGEPKVMHAISGFGLNIVDYVPQY